MVVLLNLARVAAIAVLAVVAVSLVIGIFRPETGFLEKAVLVAGFCLLVLAAAKVSTAVERLQAHFAPRA